MRTAASSSSMTKRHISGFNALPHALLYYYVAKFMLSGSNTSCLNLGTRNTLNFWDTLTNDLTIQEVLNRYDVFGFCGPFSPLSVSQGKLMEKKGLGQIICSALVGF